MENKIATVKTANSGKQTKTMKTQCKLKSLKSCNSEM